MGQKIHPLSFRLGVNKTWNSKWFVRQGYAALVRQDVQLRRYINQRLRDGGLSLIEIERSPSGLIITLNTSKPGVVIGRGGSGIEALRKDLQKKFLTGTKQTLKVNIQEVRQPDLDAQIVVKNVIDQVEKRLPFRRIMRMTVEQVTRAGAQGVRVALTGRLNGAAYARDEHLSRGKLPLQTLRANIDYARGTANTTYGTIGVKVWIYKGEVFAKQEEPLG